MSVTKSPSDFDPTRNLSPGPRVHSRQIRRLAVTAFVTLGLLAGAWYLLSGVRSAAAATPPQRTPAITVTTAKPRLTEWPLTLKASGSVAPWQEAVVGAQVGGYQLLEVRVNVGDQVRAGQILARLDSAQL